NQNWCVLNDRMEPCPLWVPGHLYIGGIGLAQGYWRDQEKTEASFVFHPASGERLYRTGDLGKYLPGGDIEFLGRQDFQVKIQGHRIELGEIEATLQDHPSVRDAVVIAQGDARGPRSLIAYVVPEEQALPPVAPAASVVPSQPLLDAQARADFKALHLNIRPSVSGSPGIALPLVEPEEAELRQYQNRLSYQQFAQDSIPLHTMSAFLSCLRQMLVGEKSRYQYASAGGIYPVQVYLYIKPECVEHLVGGTYYYHPLTHELVLLKETSAIDETVHWPSNRQAVRSSAFSIFLLGKMNAIVPLYQTTARDFCLLEAGLMTQLLETSALRHSLGLCQIGTLNFEHIREHFLLDEDHQLLHSLVGGVIPAETLARQMSETVQPAGQANEAMSHEDQLRHGTFNTASLQAYLKEHLPSYMLPAGMVVLDALPLTSNGKIDRKALPAMTLTPANPEEIRLPQDELERTIASVIQQVLEVNEINTRANFFDIGANSLSMIRAHRQLQEVLARTIPIVDIFQYPSIETLASHLRGQEDQQETLLSSQDRVQRRTSARQRRADARRTS
ncbi:MAG TPA: nitroreductase family protein, partial [Ktedonobacteraceae bacterium]|nr:nitroreductase family protein [Ktedonobacteraceae bacterium]